MYREIIIEDSVSNDAQVQNIVKTVTNIKQLDPYKATKVLKAVTDIANENGEDVPYVLPNVSKSLKDSLTSSLNSLSSNANTNINDMIKLSVALSLKSLGVTKDVKEQTHDDINKILESSNDKNQENDEIKQLYKKLSDQKSETEKAKIMSQFYEYMYDQQKDRGLAYLQTIDSVRKKAEEDAKKHFDAYNKVVEELNYTKKILETHKNTIKLYGQILKSKVSVEKDKNKKLESKIDELKEKCIQLEKMKDDLAVEVEAKMKIAEITKEYLISKLKSTSTWLIVLIASNLLFNFVYKKITGSYRKMGLFEKIKSMYRLVKENGLTVLTFTGVVSLLIIFGCLFFLIREAWETYKSLSAAFKALLTDFSELKEKYHNLKPGEKLELWWEKYETN